MVYAALVTAFTAVCSAQIIVQAWEPAGDRAASGCRDGLKGLITAIRRARDAAAFSAGGERQALSVFRAALEPEWSTRAHLTAQCTEDSAATQALSEVDRLRFAEEHALRYEALDVAGRRHRVEAIEKDLLERP